MSFFRSSPRRWGPDSQRLTLRSAKRVSKGEALVAILRDAILRIAPQDEVRCVPRSLDLAGPPGSESSLFQSAISGKNATISPRIAASSGFRCQKRGPLGPALEEEPYAEGLDDGERQRRHRRC